MAVGAFSVYGIMVRKIGTAEVQIVKERIEDGANEKAALRFPITALSFASISIFRFFLVEQSASGLQIYMGFQSDRFCPEFSMDPPITVLFYTRKPR